MSSIDRAQVETALDRVLKPLGTALRHYMPVHKEAAIDAMSAVLTEHWSQVPSIDVRARDPNDWEDQDWDEGQSIQPETATEKHPAEASHLDDGAARQSGEEDAADPVVPIQAHREVSPEGATASQPEAANGGGGNVADISTAHDDASGSEARSDASLPAIPADFHSDVPLDQLQARMRRTRKMRPDCRKPWSCGSANPGLCFACEKAAAEQEDAA